VKIKHKSNYIKAYAQPITSTRNMQYPQQVRFIFTHISSTLFYRVLTLDVKQGKWRMYITWHNGSCFVIIQAQVKIL